MVAMATYQSVVISSVGIAIEARIADSCTHVEAAAKAAVKAASEVVMAMVVVKPKAAKVVESEASSVWPT